MKAFASCLNASLHHGRMRTNDGMTSMVGARTFRWKSDEMKGLFHWSAQIFFEGVCAFILIKLFVSQSFQPVDIVRAIVIAMLYDGWLNPFKEIKDE